MSEIEAGKPADAEAVAAEAPAAEAAATEAAAAEAPASEAAATEPVTAAPAARRSGTLSAGISRLMNRSQTEDPDRKHAGRTRTAARVAAVAVLGASIGASAFFFVQGQNKQALLDAHESARSAACKYAPVLATYDAKNLDTYFAGVLDGATGDWRKQFDSTSKDLREVLTAGQVTSASTDVQCAIRSGDKDSAEAIVVIGQTITSLGTQNKPQPGQLSMVMRLERQGDRWLVNKVNSPLLQQARP
ncbi:hypothetical protein LTV02_23860 [Nocardia yamanashiensis]|uniref:hypothetical protein n=1 Tax=Nocardia yamanashiensis TaxID=209247 RepID=UPI001E493EA8|nr:hypothetical protein [Nocardia yamanashiensis]UGT39122.1 hypothetical protein LTV02_23860 [Nocardia yamanashiensis]